MAVSQVEGGVVLEGECNIDTAEGLREALLSLHGAGQRQIVLHTSGMTGVDVAVLQVVLAGRISWREMGGRLTVNPSPLLSRLLHDVGMADSVLFDP